MERCVVAMVYRGICFWFLTEQKNVETLQESTTIAPD